MLNNYAQHLDLQSYNVFHECDPYKPEFFEINGVLNKTFGFGKHSFSIAIKDNHNSNFTLKEKSNILFEVTDSFGTVIASGLTDISHVNGAAYAYFYIKDDVLGYYDEVNNGEATLTVVGTLEGSNLPQKWKNTYNVRTQIPFSIRKQNPNESPIIFKQTPVVKLASRNFAVNWDTSDYLLKNNLRNQDYHIHEFDLLETFSGELAYIDISYKLSSSKEHTDDYTTIGNIPVSSEVELLTNNINKTLGPIPLNRHKVLDDTWYSGSKAASSESIFTISQSYTGSNTVQTIKMHDLHGVHALVRKAITDEQFTIRLQPSQSGEFAIITSTTLGNLTSSLFDNGGVKDLFDSHVVMTSSRQYDIDVILKKRFYQENPTQRIGPSINDIVQPEMSGTYSEYTFDIKSGSYFALRLMSFLGSSASFSDLSIKQTPPQGENVSTFYFKNKSPLIDHGRDSVEYKYKFLNPNYENTKVFNDWPVKDLVLTTNVEQTSSNRIYHRFTGGVSHRFRSTAAVDTDGGSVGSTAIVAEAIGSGSENEQKNVWYLPSRAVTGIYAQASAVDSDEQSQNGIFAMQARGLSGLNSARSESVYSAKFHGTDRSGDVIMSQRLWIDGDSDSWSVGEHPSQSLYVVGDTLISGSISASGDIVAENYIVKSTVTEMTTSFSSGSTIFGDTNDDTHQFTGSLFISGNISASGHISGGDLYLDSTAVSPTDNETAIFMNDDPVVLKNISSRILSFGMFTAPYHQMFFTSGSDWDVHTGSNLLQPSLRITGSSGNIGIGGIFHPDEALQISGNLHVGTGSLDGNITASGNISSSETIFANHVGVANTLYHVGDLDTHLTFTDDKIQLSTGGENTFIENGHITASGNISSSNQIITKHLIIPQTGVGSIAGSGISFGALSDNVGHIYDDSDRLTLGYNDTDIVTIHDVEDSTGAVRITKNLRVGTHITASGNISASNFCEKFIQMTNSSSITDTFNTGSFRSAKYILQVTSASKFQTSEMLVLHHNSTASNTEYAQINSDTNLVDFSTDVNGANVRLIASSSFISCSVKYNRIIISS